MKRVVLSIIAVAAALVTVSCNKEQAFDSGDIAKVTYTVAGPQMVATKAMGTIGSAYTLYYEVRLWDGSTLGGKLTGEGLSGSKTVGAAEWPATVQFDLARGKQYKILFWAQSASAPEGLFTIPETEGLKAIAINYTKMAANNEECDAFSGFDVITPSGATAASATLHRPFALVNLGTSDAAQFKTASGNAEVGNVKVTVTGSLANSFNVANGTAGAGVETSFNSTAAKIDNYDKKTLSVNEVGFNYLSAVYVLPPAGEGIVNVAYEIKDNAANAITNLTVTNVPVKTNYRTNITGKLLTGSTTYNISVDQAFTGDTNKEVTPTFASIAQLNAFFASLISTGPNDPDHGDIYPESVTVTAIPAGDATTITLPNDTLSVAISILAPYAGEGGLIIAYPTAEGAKHSNKVFFNMAGLKKLTANLPDTHLEIVGGSDIDLSDVHTSASTFVIQKGARVGTANIKQGNAVIAGAVETLNVIANATADGQSPVQVKLEKDAAVEQIVLNAKTDVVVEQPKDHIDKEATEKKVAVYVEEGADNSTAKAQNGGQIYVKVASGVSCEVIADGQSTAEEGSVPSTVTIAEVGEGANVYTETSDGGKVETKDGEGIKGDVSAYVAQNKNTEVKYISLKAAIDAASAEDEIQMIANSTEGNAITVDKEITVDLNKKTVSFAGFEDTVPAILFYTEEEAIDVNISNGTLLGDNTVKWIVKYDGHGTLKMEDVVSNCAVAGGQSIRVESGNGILTNLNITTSNGSAGIYYCDSNTSGIATGVVSGCTVNQQESTSGNAWWKCALAISNGAKVTIQDCDLTGNVPLFVFTSGGEFSVKETEFHGLGGAYGPHDIFIESAQNAVPSIGLIYNDCTFSMETPVRMLAEGFPYAMAHYYINAADDALIINSQADFTYAKAKEWPLLQLGSASGNFIDAGVFNNNPSACLAEGYIANYDETTQTWTVRIDTWKGDVASDEQFAAATNDKTITISNGALLAKLAQNVNAGSNYSGYTVTLSADIDLNNQEWTPIGIYNAPFRGSFNGNNHTISHLKITKTTEYAESHRFLGLFGRAGGGSFSNVTIDGVSIIGYSRCGALLGAQDWEDSSVSISNVSVSNVSIQVGGTGGNVGAVVGRVVGSGPISNVSVTGDLCLNGSSETWDIGGITGYTYANLANCTVNVNSGSSISGGMFIGGIVGYRCEGNLTMTDCSTNSNVNGTWWVGGLVGCGQYGGTYTNCTVDHATVTVAGPPEEDPVDGVYWLEDGYNIGLFAGCAFDGWKDNSVFHESIITLSGCSFSGTLVTTRDIGVNGYCGYGYDKDTRIPVLNLVNTSINLTE